jgi:hypothetical protein
MFCGQMLSELRQQNVTISVIIAVREDGALMIKHNDGYELFYRAKYCLMLKNRDDGMNIFTN